VSDGDAGLSQNGELDAACVPWRAPAFSFRPAEHPHISARSANRSAGRASAGPPAAAGSACVSITLTPEVRMRCESGFSPWHVTFVSPHQVSINDDAQTLHSRTVRQPARRPDVNGRGATPHSAVSAKSCSLRIEQRYRGVPERRRASSSADPPHSQGHAAGRRRCRPAGQPGSDR
jgi:hypothetical protein